MTPFADIDILERDNPREAVNHVLRNTSVALEGMCREDTDQAIEDAVLKMTWAILMIRRIQRKLNVT